MSSLVVTCGDCGTSFRLDVALLQGARRGRIRCRRCGGKIVARSPEAPTVLSPDDAVPIYPGVPSAEPEPAPPPQPEAAWPGTDTGRQKVHDPGNADPVPPEKPGAIYFRMEDLFADPRGAVLEDPGGRLPTGSTAKSARHWAHTSGPGDARAAVQFFSPRKACILYIRSNGAAREGPRRGPSPGIDIRKLCNYNVVIRVERYGGDR